MQSSRFSHTVVVILIPECQEDFSNSSLAFSQKYLLTHLEKLKPSSVISVFCGWQKKRPTHTLHHQAFVDKNFTVGSLRQTLEEREFSSLLVIDLSLPLVFCPYPKLLLSLGETPLVVGLSYQLIENAASPCLLEDDKTITRLTGDPGDFLDCYSYAGVSLVSKDYLCQTHLGLLGNFGSTSHLGACVFLSKSTQW